MPDYTRSTGNGGTMMIRDTGTMVEFWLKGPSGTYNSALPYRYGVNGVTSPWKTFNFKSGGAYQKLGSWAVSSKQTVWYYIGDTGTSGIGGPTTFSQLITRGSSGGGGSTPTTTRPGKPPYPTYSEITATSVLVTMRDGSTGGLPITRRQVALSNDPLWSGDIKNYTGPTRYTGLTPGTRYSGTAQTFNAKGGSDISEGSGFTTGEPASAPSAVRLSDITQTSIRASFSPGNTGSEQILEHEISYGTNSQLPQDSVYETQATINNLIPNTRYYFWGRVRTASGWSPRSPRSSATTGAGLMYNHNNNWNGATPYVKINGVWRRAQPWIKVSGEWKETK